MRRFDWLDWALIGLLVGFLTAAMLTACHATAPAPYPVRVAAEEYLEPSLTEAAQTWNDAAGCRIVEVSRRAPIDWFVLVGGDLGKGSTYAGSRIATVNGVGEYACQVAALAHELGHMLNAEHSTGGMAPRIGCGYWAPPAEMVREAQRRCRP